MTVTTPEQRLAANLLAEDAATAKAAAGPCCLCRHVIARGDRYARIVTSGQLAHIACVARLALRRPVPVIR
jgi:hypothetical protein